MKELYAEMQNKYNLYIYSIPNNKQFQRIYHLDIPMKKIVADLKLIFSIDYKIECFVSNQQFVGED